jgi:hypothetical protein
MLGMFMIYVVTLSIFPGFLAEDAKVCARAGDCFAFFALE